MHKNPNFFARPFGFCLMIVCQIIGGPAFGPIGLFSSVFLIASWGWGPPFFQVLLAFQGLFLLIAVERMIDRRR